MNLLVDSKNLMTKTVGIHRYLQCFMMMLQFLVMVYGTLLLIEDQSLPICQLFRYVINLYINLKERF